MYKCQQSMVPLSTMEILALIEETEERRNTIITRGQWYLGMTVLLFLMTCCHGG